MASLRRFLWVFLVWLSLACCAAGAALDEAGEPYRPDEIEGPSGRIKIDLPGARDSVKIVQLRDGSIRFVLERLGSGTDRMVTPEEFSRLVYKSKTGGGWLETLFNITSPIGILWVSLGFLGQIVFAGRMIVQWFASERTGRSVIPIAFWWMSLVGATMLIVYFIWRRDIVGVLGQATGWFIYIRNLVLIRRSRGG